MIVVDSSVWIANLRNEERPSTAYLRWLPEPIETIVVGDIVLLEVLRGARDERHAASIEFTLRRFNVDGMLDQNAAVAAAHSYRLLRRRGVTVSKIPDLLIATYCIRHGYPLLHDDRDFSPFQSLGLTFAI